MTARRSGLVLLALVGAVLALSTWCGSPAQAAPLPGATTTTTTTTPVRTTTGIAPAARDVPTPVAKPDGPAGPAGPTVEVKLPDKPSDSITAILGLTVLAIAPALLALTTSFTKIVVVLSLTRNALGLSNVPPNQVLAGLALVMSIFVMTPVFTQVNDDGVQPYLNGTKTQQQAWTDGTAPLKTFMLAHTREAELTMFIEASKEKRPQTREDVSLATLVPAFVISELKSAFIIGFVIFLPFLLIDLVVSSSLMSLGMMMMPPVLVSLPFKLLLFVLVDGWALVAHALLASY